MACHVIFPAAGVGRRFGAELPKQYCTIRRQTVMAWTLSVWRDVAGIDSQLIAISSDDSYFAGVHADFPYLQVVAGGQERDESVLNALRALAQTAAADDWVMVHDIARPCVRRTDIERLLAYCQQHQVGAILARPLTDTIKYSQDTLIGHTLDRRQLWAAQTPQCFPLGQLLSAMETARADGLQLTDEASALEAAGLPVHLLAGSADNLKLTHADDLALADFYLTQQGF